MSNDTSPFISAMYRLCLLSSLPLLLQLVPLTFSFHLPSRATTHRPLSEFNKLQSANEDDDGWADEPSNGTSDVLEKSIAGDDRVTIKSRELERLQSEMAAKSSYPDNNTPTASSGERDLFIPIFTLVAVIGFTGLYGYEMLRLYSRGELYFPWEQ